MSGLFVHVRFPYGKCVLRLASCSEKCICHFSLLKNVSSLAFFSVLIGFDKSCYCRPNYQTTEYVLLPLATIQPNLDEPASFVTVVCLFLTSSVPSRMFDTAYSVVWVRSGFDCFFSFVRIRASLVSIPISVNVAPVMGILFNSVFSFICNVKTF